MMLAGFLVLMGWAALIALKVGLPRDITVDITPERIARGEYLANHVTHCNYCHSDVDWDYYPGAYSLPFTLTERPPCRISPYTRLLARSYTKTGFPLTSSNEEKLHVFARVFIIDNRKLPDVTIGGWRSYRRLH